MADFPIPAFLENQSLDEIHKRMLDQLPADIDKSEGGHPWNLTRPTAYAAAYFAEYIMVEAIKLIFPKYAQDYADVMIDHADTRGLERKTATYAVGEIIVTGDAGTEIPAGTSFSTASVNGEPAVEFVTVEDAKIDDTGSVTIEIQAVEAGTVGNVPADTIILKANQISGISGVTNLEDTTGGTEEESIESLQARIVDLDKSKAASYVGSEADYRRWALEVNGTGSAVIVPASDESGLITIILTDANGEPANDELCETVYNHIIRPDSPSERLAPVNGGNILVVAPETVSITVSVVVESSSASADTIKSALLASMKNYLIEATQDKEVRWTKIGYLISKTEGVEDYKSLLLNGGTENISINNQQLPIIEEENLIVKIGTV